MRNRAAGVSLLLFGSGFTALVYQVAWLRSLRLVFGSSTAASSAVLAVFLGGLGFGSLLLGRRVDVLRRPLLFYGGLELAIAGLAALSPLLVWLARAGYVAVGGTPVLGAFFGTIARIALSAVVLGLPTFLMGGTLPAATRAIETDEDLGRTRLALLYGTNTLGAVTGAWLANFVLLERLGTRGTLWAACAVNVAVAAIACAWGARSALAAAPQAVPAKGKKKEAGREKPRPPAISGRSSRFVLAVAGLVGFAFMLMELVWYRMLAPLLGGSTYSFGLILAVALLGIGLGSAVYASRPAGRVPTLATLALTCAVEGVALIFPYALGDFVALLAILARSLGVLGFPGYVLGWTAITALVVLPASIAAGVQFPVLIALLGRGREDVGRHVGYAYAANTLGCIAGALCGGFGLLPLLTAPGAWRLAALLLAAVGIAAAAMDGPKSSRRLRAVAWSAALATAALAAARGPTAAWRQSPIGAGRVQFEQWTPNLVTQWIHERRRLMEWQRDGIESSVGLLRSSEGFAFALNGKIDGNSRTDAPTQVMGGLLGVALQGNTRRALVIGLGTGSTAGWLAQIPSMERVDVVELEPAVLDVGRACAAVNARALENPRVHVSLGDARELLLTGRETYDLVFSEPSNPYRAGIASLFTREFYRSVSDRLAPRGMFIQWMQAYEVDSETVRAVYATLASVFPSVETWRGKRNDLLLIGSDAPFVPDAAQLRTRLAAAPFSESMARAWRVAGPEGLASHYLAGNGLARAIAARDHDLVNTDDRNRIEFALARSLGRTELFDSEEIRQLARARGEDRPPFEGDLDWNRVDRDRQATTVAEYAYPAREAGADPRSAARGEAFAGFVDGRLEAVLPAWRAQSRPPDPGTELAMVAEALVAAGDESAPAYLERLAAEEPVEAGTLRARWSFRRGNVREAASELVAALRAYRQDPWPLPFLIKRSLPFAAAIASREPGLAPELYDALAEPFALRLLEDERVAALLEVASYISLAKYAEAMARIEPDVPWQRSLLTRRADAYTKTKNPLAARARADLALFEGREPRSFDAGLPRPGPIEPPGSRGRP